MLSKSQLSFIKSLHHKKYRKRHGRFLVEGIKSITEFIASDFYIEHVYHTPEAVANLAKIPGNIKCTQVTEADMMKISTLDAPQGILAIVYMKDPITILPPNLFRGSYSLFLDGIQNPGNLGTIIRTADWFGIDRIVCSEDCAEFYNPKVIQASMGSAARIPISYFSLDGLLRQTDVPVYGAFLGGTSVYETDFGKEAIIVLGNEGNGISETTAALIRHRVTIPRFGAGESLNVAVSAGIFCAAIRSNRR